MTNDVLTDDEKGADMIVVGDKSLRSRVMRYTRQGATIGITHETVRMLLADAEILLQLLDRAMQGLELIAIERHKVTLSEPVDWYEVSDTFVGIAKNTLAEIRKQLGNKP